MVLNSSSCFINPELPIFQHSRSYFTYKKNYEFFKNKKLKKKSNEKRKIMKQKKINDNKTRISKLKSKQKKH